MFFVPHSMRANRQRITTNKNNMKHRLLIALALCASSISMMADGYEYSYEVVPATEGTIEVLDNGSGSYRLTASPLVEGWTFAGWDDDGDGIIDNTTSPRNVTLATSERMYRAIFEDHRCALYAPKYPAPVGGGGTVSAAAGSCECDWILTATPTSGWAFKEWNDGNTSNPRTVSVDPDEDEVSYTATFVPACVVNKPVIASVTGLDSKSVTAVCPGGCEWTLEVTAEDDYTFVRWSDGTTDNPRTVTSDDSGPVTYTPIVEDHRCSSYPPLIASVVGVTASSITPTANECEWTISVTTNTAECYRFVHWDDLDTSDPDYAANPRTVTSTNGQGASITYTPVVEQTTCLYEPAYTPGEGGTVAAVMTNECDCEWQLTATPTEGYAFLQWEDCNYLNPRTVTVDPDAGTQSYTAHFLLSDAFIDSWTETDIVVGTKTQDLTPTNATIRFNGVEIDPAHTNQDPDPVTGEVGLWTLPGGLNDYAGQPISIVFYDDETGMPVGVINSTVPYISTGDKNFSSIVPPLPENTDVEVVDGTLTFDSDEPMVLGALTVHPDAKAVVPTGKEVTFTHIYMLGNGPEKKYPQLVANGTIHNLNSDTIYYDYTLDYKDYYPLAVPYDVTCAKIRTKSGKAASYEVQWYNGEDRACNASGWTVFDDQAVGATLRTGKGYIVYAVPYKWNGTRHKTVAVRFPMVAPLTTAETEKSTTVSTYGGEWTSASNKNWNLVGNPYLANYTTSDDARLMVGTYDPAISTAEIERYTYTDDGVRYVTMTTDGFQTYNQSRADEGVTIKSFTNFFIQSATSGALVFTLSQRAQNAPRRNVQRDNVQGTKEIAFGIVLTATDKSDRTGLLYGEDFTEAYEMNADLVKMSGSTPVLELYSLAGDEKRAFNALNMTAIRTLVPLGYTNAPMGQMSIAFDYDHYDASALEAVMLTDYETGRVVNLLEQDYTFTNHAAHSDNRLAINAVVLPKTPEVATELNDQMVNDQMVNDQMVNGVYDLLGRKVTLENLPQGVYIIIENGQSRKEVIR